MDSPRKISGISTKAFGPIHSELMGGGTLCPWWVVLGSWHSFAIAIGGRSDNALPVLTACQFALKPSW